MQEKVKSFIRGHLKMVEINRETGERSVVFDDDNVITLQGFQAIMDRILTETSEPAISGAYIWNIVLGDDVGSGDQFSPEPADDTLTDSDQNVVYSIPNEDITFNNPTPKLLELGTILDGQAIMDSNFPTDVDMRYTSATIRFFDGKTLSYKRFPVRSLSRAIDIQITWQITFEEVNP